MKPNADWLRSTQKLRARSSTCCISCRRESGMETEDSDCSCCRKAEAGDSCMVLVMLAPDGHRISSMVTEGVKALTAAEISELCTRHTLYDWSAQAGLKPMAVASAKGVHFTTVDGRRFIDFNSQLMSVNAGHGDRRIIDAIKPQAEQLPYITPFMAHEPPARLGQKLAELLPRHIEKALFTLARADANEHAIKIARTVTGRPKIMARYRSYHRSTV